MNQQTTTSARYARIDLARGIALLAMASYHFTWDLEFFGYLQPGTANSGALKIYARTIASSFLFLAGMGVYWANSKAIRWPHFFKRLGKIASAAALISVATWLATPSAFVYFGILHAIATMSLIGLAFVHVPAAVTALAAIAAYFSPVFFSGSFQSPWMLWAGLNAQTLPSNDYVPLLPWASAFLAGLAAAKFITQNGWTKRLFASSGDRNIFHRSLSFMGRHSLAIYLLHQPLLVACVWLWSVVFPPVVTATF